MDLSLSDAGYPSAEARGAFLQRLEERIEALPGVEGVTAPGGGIMFVTSLEAEGRAPHGANRGPIIIPHSEVTSDYFGVLEVPIRAGRAFDAADAGTDNVVVDEDLARTLWGGENPVGRRFRTGPESEWMTVVGVIGDLKLIGPDERQGDYEILYPGSDATAPSYLQLAIRTRGESAALFGSIRNALHELDPRQPISDLRPATEVYAEFIDMPRFLLLVAAVLSGIGLLLAALGVYGILAYSVAERQRELGIRVALGARPARLARGVLGEGLVLGAVGVAIGIGGALALAHVIRGLLYGIEPTDPATVAMVAVVSLAASALAAYLPARRATRVDPMVALRAE